MASEVLPLEDLVTCAICQEVFCEPIALHCLHTLCRNCVDSLRKRFSASKNIQCPICREVGDVHSLKNDFRVKHLVDIYKSQLKLKRKMSVEVTEHCRCELCFKRAFTAKCVDCDKLICNGCQATHNGIPSCVSHTVLSLQDLLVHNANSLKQLRQVLCDDQKIIVDKLHSLEQYLNDLNRVKQTTKSSLQILEQAAIERVRSHFCILHKQLETETSNHATVAKEVKGQIIEVMDKVMERSHRIVDTLSGTDALTVMKKIKALKSDDILLNSEEYLLLPKLDISVNTTVCDIIDLSKLGKFEVTSEAAKLCGEKHNPSNTLKFVDVLQNASESLDHNESSSLRYNFRYNEQVCALLKELERNVEAFANEHDCGGIGDISLPGRTACMVSPSASMRRCLASGSRRRVDVTQLMSPATVEPLECVRQVPLVKSDEPQSLQVIGNELFCFYHDWVHVYDFELNLKRDIQRHALKAETCLTMKSGCLTRTGHYLLACDTEGLRMIHPDLRGRNHVLHRGIICDVTVDGDEAFALDVRRGEIVVFRCTWPHRYIPNQQCYPIPWQWDRAIKCRFALSIDDTLSISGGVVYVCSYRNESIYRYHARDGRLLASVKGSGLRTAPGHLWRPRLCCKLPGGALLVADHYNNRLQVLDVSDANASEDTGGSGGEAAEGGSGRSEAAAEPRQGGSSPPPNQGTSFTGQRTPDAVQSTGLASPQSSPVSHGNQIAGVGRWQVLQFSQALNYPWDAMLLPGYGLVVLEKCHWKHKLIQFALPESTDSE